LIEVLLFSLSLRRSALAAVAALLLVLPAGAPPVAARPAPDSFADLADKLLPSVVNISTTQTLKTDKQKESTPGRPKFPPGSPFEEFFKDFFKDHDTPQSGRPEAKPRKATSLGSGFVVDAGGYIVTNNHVIADADEITVKLADNTELKAEVVGRDTKTDVAVLKVKTTKPLVATRWGDSDKSRVGDWVLAIGNPFGLGGSVTAGILSARQRDIQSGPYDDFLQTDAAINRGNSGGPLFNLDGEVIGVNTAIISPSGGSIGIGFAVPSTTAMAVLDQLREFKEVRRGWLGVKIQQVTEEIAESLGIKPVRGALVAGIDDKGPAKPAGIEPGDVIVKFDGKDIKEMRDLPKIVGDTPVGKDVPVVIVRKGKEETKTVRLGRLEDAPQQASVKTDAPAEEKSVVQKALGLNLAGMSDDLRKKYKIKESVKGVVITAVDANSAASEKRLNAGDVIVKVTDEEVVNPADVQKRIDQLKKDGKKTALLLVANADGDVRFVALGLQ
jgi:serine protease Do